ncbi:MAG TPA: PAS domain S-box protein [Candidatus Eisenbacteria bacterium]|nr:PAS domain S-box protein [Candidatus Eisenbacteria bacterium]
MFSFAKSLLNHGWPQYSRRRNRHVFDPFSISAAAGLALLDSTFRVMRINDKMAEMVGLPAEKMIGENALSLIPRLAAAVEPILKGVRGTHTPALNVHLEGETFAKPGAVRHWTVSVFPIVESGHPTGDIGAIAVETTDQIQFQLLEEAERIAHLGSWESNAANDELTCSMNFRRMACLDLARTTFSRKELESLVRPKDREAIYAAIEWAKKDGQPFEFRARFLRPDGRERVFFVCGMPTPGLAAWSGKRVGFIQDITDQVEAEKALLQSEERYRDLIENSHDLICTHDLDGRVLWMNPLPAQILGYSAEKLIGRRIPDMLEPEFREQFNSYIATIQREGRAEGVMRLVTSAGERRFWEYRNTLRHVDDGPPIVRGMAHDITERIRTEKSLRMFRTLIDQSSDALEVIDPQTFKLLDISQRECSDLGYTREELLQMTVFDIDPTLDRAEALKERAELSRVGSLRREGLHRRKDGSTFPVEVNIRYVSLGGEYIVAAVRDITERKKAQEELDKQAAIVRGLLETARILTKTLDLQEILVALNSQSIKLIGAKSGCAGMKTKEGFSCDSFVAEGENTSTKMDFTWPVGVGIPGWVLENKRPYLTNDAATDVRINPEVREALALTNILCVPVFDIPEREVIAFFALHNKPGRFEPADVETAQGIASVASIALQNSLTHEGVCQSEAALRGLSQKLMRSQEDERRRIARELHEEMAQELSVVQRVLGGLKHLDRRKKEPWKALDDCVAILRRTLDEVRTLSYALRPPVELNGLRNTVLWYARTFSQINGIDVEVDVRDNIDDLTEEQATALFRITQEALSNVLLHFGCRHAKLHICRTAEHVELELQDLSKIVRLRQDEDTYLAEITSVKERARQHGGTTEIESIPGEAVKIRVQLPTAKAANA